jgi:hypothetical protein
LSAVSTRQAWVSVAPASTGANDCSVASSAAGSGLRVLCSSRARPNITSAIATTSSARSARCVAGYRKLPPQLVLVFDMAVGEEQQPGDRHQHQAEVAQPWPRPGFVQQRAWR